MMKHVTISKIQFISLSFLAYIFLFPQKCRALFLEDPDIIEDPVDSFNEGAGFDTNSSIEAIVGTGIEAFLGLLGIIFIVLIIYGGYVYMMAGGNEQEVDKAKTTLRRAIIGLIITVSAYTITYFVFSNLTTE